MSFFFNSKKGQSSFEYIIIFGIGFSLIVLFGGLFFSYSSGTQNSLDKKQIENFMLETTNNIEKIYFLGKGNRITMDSNFPERIQNFSIVHRNNSGIEFDYFNITTYDDSGQLIVNIFDTKETYIRFNCTSCYHSPNIGGNWTSHFNESDFVEGLKTIRIESKGNWVSFDFIKE